VDHSRSRTGPIWVRRPEPALVVNLLHLAARHTVRDKSIKPSLGPNKRLHPILLSPIFRLWAMDEWMIIGPQPGRGYPIYPVSSPL